MALSPVLVRELLVAARKKGTYWLRCALATGALALFFSLLLSRQSLVQPGPDLFSALGMLCFSFCLLSGVFLTADSVAREKREGAIGLLFLTDLTGGDVILGKMAAQSLHAFFGLLAVFPVLGLPFLLGGVKPGEFCRLLLVLVLTMFGSLALGLLVSTNVRRAAQAWGVTLFLIAAASGLLPAFWWLQKITLNNSRLDALLWPSPVYAYFAAFDTAYSRHGGAQSFWISAAFQAVAILILVAAAVWCVTRAWRQTETEPAANNRPQTPPARRRLSALLDLISAGNPFCLVTLRQRSFGVVGKLFILLVVLWAIFLALAPPTARAGAPVAFITAIFFGFGLHVLTKIFLALEAARRFRDDEAGGALEIVLTTPLSADDIVDAELLGLACRFFPPILILAAVNVALLLVSIFAHRALQIDAQDLTTFATMFLGGIAVLLVDSWALSWVGLWAGLKRKTHASAVFLTLAQTLGLPWLVIFFVAFARPAWGQNEFQAFVIFWFTGGMILSGLAGTSARRRLRSDLRAAATGELQPAPRAKSPVVFRPPSLARSGGPGLA